MAGIYDNCAHCGCALAHSPGRGKATKYCSAQCRGAAYAQRENERAYPECAVQGCHMDAVRVGHGLCEKHYMRMRRADEPKPIPKMKVEPEPRIIPEVLSDKAGYILQMAPDHPLRTGASKRVRQHRVVYYNAHGDGPFDCHWCKKAVTWKTLHIDHVDDDKTNNALSNLVASCPRCNQQRGFPKAMATKRAKTGVTIDGVCRTLNEWSDLAGISRTSIIRRMKLGWDAKDAVFKPRGKTGPAYGRTKVGRGFA